MFSKDNRSQRAVLAARDNIAHLLSWTRGKAIVDLQGDTMLRYAVERAFMALDAAMRDVPAELILEHRVPARLIAGFRNILAHSYEDILDERIVTTIGQDLPLLDAQLAAILTSLEQRG